MSNRLPRTANLAAAGSPTNILPPSPAPAGPAPRTPAAAHFQLPLAFALPAAGAPLLTPLQRATRAASPAGPPFFPCCAHLPPPHPYSPQTLRNSARPAWVSGGLVWVGWGGGRDPAGLRSFGRHCPLLVRFWNCFISSSSRPFLPVGLVSDLP